MWRDNMAEQTDWNLGDDSQGGCLNQFGELRADKRRSEQCVGLGVNHQFCPSLEAIPVKGQKCHCAGVVGSSRPYRESFCSGLAFGASHHGYLRLGVDHLRQIAGITGGQLGLGQFSPRSAGRDDVGNNTAVVGGDMGQPGAPGGISQRVEPTASDADRL
jgi:hypothetical protein